MIFLNCLHCGRKLKINKYSGNLIKCSCQTYNILREKDKLPKDFLKYLPKEVMGTYKDLGDKILINIHFDNKNILILGKKSKETSKALETLLYDNKEKLTKKQRDLLYRLKTDSISKIIEQIDYLTAKINCIEFLKVIDF